ncbi:MAG: hypothetical protein H0A75_09110 [Candidatus Methanofishera endochildressiae]|uniref:Uncharacterized protein n=1 Tax=Candidatus Methanofishera endochildressiae TaxID=2738884 RepID=A0A7Z0MPU4_9GAMM|nr:hypothetical protein [Candidatus Methanofishera endochildressiae]
MTTVAVCARVRAVEGELYLDALKNGKLMILKFETMTNTQNCCTGAESLINLGKE